MTPANATSVNEMIYEIEVLIACEPAVEQLEMLAAISTGITKIASDIVTVPDTAHDHALKVAEDKRDIEKGKQP